MQRWTKEGLEVSILKRKIEDDAQLRSIFRLKFTPNFNLEDVRRLPDLLDSYVTCRNTDLDSTSTGHRRRRAALLLPSVQ
ncbi:hypothetical protein M758_3G076900 [Ceratodon purpureus]|nr:hypothetical protein M758_3G076900 [Ceratodon purpureus]